MQFSRQQHQQKPEVLHTFIPTKPFGYLLHIEPNSLVFGSKYYTVSNRRQS